MLRINRPVGQQRVAKPPNGGGHHIQLIIDLSVRGKLFVLNNHRHIVYPPLFWQEQFANVFIFNQYQARQSHRHLTTGFPMLMRVEPAGCRTLFRREGDGALAARRNHPLRAAVHLAGNFQPMPVQRRLLGKLVMNIHGNTLTFAQLKRRPE